MKKYILIAALVLGSFFASYSFASARQAERVTTSASQLTAYQEPAPSQATASSGGCGGGCCGGGGAPVEGATAVEGDVQTLTIDTSTGAFNPNVVKAKAGVPLKLTFSQAPGGCMSGVMFPDFNIDEDLTGGAKTIELPALEPGEYTFFCQMQMVSGKLVVE